MGIISEIKQSAGKYIFYRKLNNLKRNKKLVNLNEAKAVGIVYNVTNQEIFRKVKLLIKDLTTTKRQVMAVGFVNKKSIPNYCVAAYSGYYFDQKDLNWFGGPKNDYIKEFINKEWDILIDLTMEDVFAIQFISGLSKSRFKVGRYSESHKKYYDLMIKVNNSLSIDAFIEQILHYLLILKSNN